MLEEQPAACVQVGGCLCNDGGQRFESSGSSVKRKLGLGDEGCERRIIGGDIRWISDDQIETPRLQGLERRA